MWVIESADTKTQMMEILDTIKDDVQSTVALMEQMALTWLPDYQQLLKLNNCAEYWQQFWTSDPSDHWTLEERRRNMNVSCNRSNTHASISYIGLNEYRSLRKQM